jgi:glutaredoxin
MPLTLDTVAEPHLTTLLTTRSCRHCRMALALSHNPLVIDERYVLCDICAERFILQVGNGVRVFAERRKIKQQIEDVSREREDLETEMGGLERQMRELDRRLKELREQLEKAR